MREKLEGGLIIAAWLVYCTIWGVTILMLLVEKDRRDNDNSD